MTIELRWLSAADDEVAAAMATLRSASRPAWVPTRRQILVHVNQCLILWYLFIVFMAFGIRVDVFHDSQADASDIRGLTVTMTILAVWLFGTYWLHRWAAKPPSSRVRLNQWRQDLTAMANGFEPRPSRGATFSSLITTDIRSVQMYPRFTAAGVEFGNLSGSGSRSKKWHYVAVTLPAPLPHLILDATATNGIRSDLPVGAERDQRLSLEGDFDRWFHVYAPEKYGADALYFLTPDVMAALIDDASAYNIEIIDNTLVFFTSTPADFTTAHPWQSVHGILTDAAQRIVTSAKRYRDERVPGQEVPVLISRIRAEIDTPDIPWVAPRPIIGPDGRRLDMRDRYSRVRWVLSVVGVIAFYTFIYIIPGLFAFAGFMSIIDGK